VLRKKLNSHNENESTHSCESLSALVYDNPLNQDTHTLYRSKSWPFLSKSINNELSNFKTFDKVDYTLTNNRTFITIKVNDKAIIGLLDTGATCCFMGISLKDLFDKSECQSVFKPISVKVANGQLIFCNHVKTIPITYNNETKLIKCIYLAELSSPLILGMNFFTAFKFDFFQQTRCISNTSTDEEFHLDLIPSESVEEKFILTKSQQLQLDEIYSLFNFSDQDTIGCQNVIEHNINTGEHSPIAQPQYSFNPLVLSEIYKIVDVWYAQGVIEKSKSPWRNPVVAAKKADGSIRLCLDARKLNNITKRDRLLTPNVFDSLNCIPSDAKVFGRIDKNQAFLQTKLRECDKEKTAFFIKGKGLFHFTRMPFGLTNAPATQTRLMLEIFGDLVPYILVYFDDILILARDLDHFFQLTRLVATRLKENNITISRNKLNLVLKSIKILGHVVDENGIHVNPDRVAPIKFWPKPTSKLELQRFLGFINWYRRHIKDCSLIATPLTELTKNKFFEWSPKAEFSFESLKTALINSSVLKRPRWDLPMTLLCDASDYGVGAALVQIDENHQENVIEFFSSKLSDRERKYSVTEKECLSVIKAIIHFRSFIELTELRIITDHRALSNLLSMKVITGRLARWILFLQQYVNCIEHRAGKLMKIPDALSRAPVMITENEGDHLALGLISIDDDRMNNYLKLKNSVILFPRKYPVHHVSKDQLYQKTKFNRNNNNDDWRLIPSPHLLEDLILTSHLDTLHGGINKTMYHLQQKFFWKEMRLDVKRLISSCFECASIKAKNFRSTGQIKHFRIPKSCMETVAIDIKGPLPSAGRQRYRFVLVLMDILSRFAWCALFNSVTSQHVIKFCDKIFSQYKYPKNIIHDNGSQFVSHDFKDFLGKNAIISCSTPIYTPRNNPVERFNRSLGEGLSLCMIETPLNHKKWISYIHEIVHKLNYRLNDATQMTPVEVLYGYTPNNDSNLIPRLDKKHKELMTLAHNNSFKRFLQNQSQYNKDKTDINFKANDLVMCKTHFQSNMAKSYNSKLDVNYIAGIILEKSFNNAYKIKLVDGRTTILDTTHLKPISEDLQHVLRDLFILTDEEILNCHTFP
jgi:transposase InsO family protein/predicted aspartyl protease